MAFESLKAKYAEYKKKRDTEKIAKAREKAELESDIEKAKAEERDLFAEQQKVRSVEEARQHEIAKEEARVKAIQTAKEKEKARLEAPERRKKAFKEGVKKAETGFWKAIDTATEKAVAYGKKEFKGKPTHRKHKIRKIPIQFSGKYPEVQWAKRRPTYGYRAKKRVGESDREFGRRQSTVLRPSHLPVHQRPHKRHKSRTSHKRSTRRKRDDGGWFLG
jgi:hypothetical protein